MSERSVADDLESALLDRARRLADEHLAHAQQIREQIIQEENERLRLREEREVLSAKEMAERLYRRQVQSSQLELRAGLERQRWDSIQAIMKRLAERLAQRADDEAQYIPLLQALLAEAAGHLPGNDLVAELNARDLERFRSRWGDIAGLAAAGRAVTLGADAIRCAGGLRVHDRDNRVLVDNTFEGRVDRLRDVLHQLISEHLFARAGDLGGWPRG